MVTNSNFDPMQTQLLQQQQQQQQLQQQLTPMSFDANMSYYQSPQQPPSLNTTPTPTNTTSFNSTTPVNFNFPTTPVTASTPTTAVNTNHEFVIVNNNMIQNYMGSSPLPGDH